MANKLTAINTLRPKLKMGRLVRMDQIDPYVAVRSGLNKGAILHVVNELRDAIVFFARDGRAIRMEGFGRFTPKIGLDGKFSMSVSLDPILQKQINIPKEYMGEIVNRPNIGLTPDELIAQWNELYPGDPVPPEIPPLP